MYCPAQVNMLIDCTLQQALFHESLQQHDYASLQDPQTCSSDVKHEQQDAKRKKLACKPHLWPSHPQQLLHSFAGSV